MILQHGGWRVWLAERPDKAFAIEVRIYHDDQDGTTTVLVPNPKGTDFLKKKFNRHQSYLVNEPTFMLEGNMAQSLMDSMWKIGVRPNSGRRYEEEMALVKNHLDDMRTLVFEHPKPELRVIENKK